MDRAASGQGSAPIREGAILAGRYRIEGAIELGEDSEGDAVTVPGIDLAIGRVLVRAFRLGPGVSMGAALAVARAAKQIESDRAERILDAGEIDPRTLYLVTEARAGVELGAIVRSAGPLPMTEAVSVVSEACAVLAEAHGRGVCHGDLSPESFSTTRRADGSLAIKVTGFGEPRREGAGLFCAPEQRSPGAVPTARSDLWSLGAILFYLLTGAPVGARRRAAADLRALRPAVPVALERVVIRCLLEDPRTRYASVTELGRALAFFLPGSAEVDRIAPASRAAWLRGVVALSVVGLAAFTGLAFTMASHADLATAIRPFEELFAPR